MMLESRIQYMPGHEVDRVKWDTCVENASNGLIFGYKICLDMLADHWNAIVIDDYKAVMPLPWRKSFLLPHHYRAPFLPQCGIFGEIDESLFKQLRKTIFSKLKFGDISFNFGNAEFAREFPSRPATNMILPLNAVYTDLRKNYHRHLERSLKKATTGDLEFTSDTNVKSVVSLFRKHYGSRIRPVRSIDFERFTSLCLHLQQVNKAFLRKVVDKRGKLLSITLMLQDTKRLYNMLNVVTPEGRRKSANHLLFDRIVADFANSGLILDFEGSEVPGLRRFYEGFGAINQPYFWCRKIL